MEQERLQDIENYLWRGEYPASTEKTSQTLGEDVEKTTSLKEQFSTTTHAPVKRLQQAQTNSHAADSGVRRRKSWSHAIPLTATVHVRGGGGVIFSRGGSLVLRS